MKKNSKMKQSRADKRYFEKHKRARKNQGMHFVFVVTVIRTAIATYKVTGGDAAKGESARKVVTACAGNPNVPIPGPTIAIYVDHIDSYDARKPANKKERWRVVKVDIDALKGVTQTFANAEPESSNEIIVSAGFTVKVVTVRQKGIFTVKNGVDSGTIDLTGPSVKVKHCQDWWYSDDGITYVRMRPTLEAATQMTGLTPGKYAWFKNELIVMKDGKGLSNAIKIMVK
jgi:hypothetical protein